MLGYVNDNRLIKQTVRLFCFFCFLFCLCIEPARAQNPPSPNTIAPFEELLKRPVKIRSELSGVHPRLFFTAKELPAMRERARGVDRELWQETLGAIKTLKRNALDPKDEDLYKSGLDKRKPGSISQYEFAFQIAQTAYAYAIEEDEKYLEAAKKWTLTACEMPLWGYTYNKPNVDLPPAHLLYAVAFAYDVLFDRLTKEERATIKNKLVKQGGLMFDYFKYKPKKRYTYTQNHTWIPMSGLAIAAYAIMDEADEAKEWAQLARAVFDRTMTAFGTDGFFYESFHYYGFAFRWTIRYFDAHLHATGENLYSPMRSKLAGMKLFVMHSILPDRENIFDFADVGDGSLNRNKISKREKLYGEYDILYRLASVYQDAQAQAVADFVRTQTDFGTREPMWAFINHNANLKSIPLSQIPTQVYFNDNDTVFWRSSWERDATAFAFRCAPPEGHHAARLSGKISDWRQNTGHAHPDANSFIIFANGKYLTGDTGYLGIKQTDDHNTILVNRRGQEKDGVYEMFKEVPNERLDLVRIAEVWATPDYFYARGEAAAGYYADLNLQKFDRHFLHVAPDYFVVWDELQTSAPAEFIFLLNTDREAKILDRNTAELTNENAGLRVMRIAPAAAKSEIVPQLIQARGLPGSVDKGESEQRGVQLQTTTAEKSARADFLHFLQPFSTTDKMSAPRISALENNAKGLKINWANGGEEFVLLGGNGDGIETNAARAVLRLSSQGTWRRLVLQNGSELKRGGNVLLAANAPVGATLNFVAANKISGWIAAQTDANVKLNVSFAPRAVLVNGKRTSFAFDDRKNLLSVSLRAGNNKIEIE